MSGLVESPGDKLPKNKSSNDQVNQAGPKTFKKKDSQELEVVPVKLDNNPPIQPVVSTSYTLYPGLTIIGKGAFKTVVNATDIEMPGIELTEPPEKVVVAICKTSNELEQKVILDEILLQIQFSKNTPQLAPRIYGVAVYNSNTKSWKKYIETHQDPVETQIGSHTESATFEETFYIYQQKCDYDLNTFIHKTINQPNKNISEFLSVIHKRVIKIISNIVDFGYINVDTKPSNFCCINENADVNIIGLDIDPRFMRPFKKILEAQIPEKELLKKGLLETKLSKKEVLEKGLLEKEVLEKGLLEKEVLETQILKFSKNAKIFMLILYYIVFIHSYTKYTTIISGLLVKDSINGDLILEVFEFMQKKEYSTIFIYNGYNHNPTFIIKHYLVHYIVKNEKKEIDTARREIASMDNIALANKICEVLGIPLSSSATTINATTNASTSAASTSAAGSRKRRNNKRHSKKRKSISSKKHINK
jgi:hypothetical protein